MDLWSDDPAERLAAGRDHAIVGDWPSRIGFRAPMQPWPYGMPSSINPYVIFLGPSPGGSPPAGDIIHQVCGPYELPTAGIPHPRIRDNDGRNYWPRVRELGTSIVRAHAPGMTDTDALALIGQLNLAIGQSGEARKVRLDPEYCAWVPNAILDHLRPSYVIILGLAGLLMKPNAGFDPRGRLGINWRKPEASFPFMAPKALRYKFRLWRRTRPDGRITQFVLWPQHPSRPPMTGGTFWQDAAREFIAHARG